MLRLGRGTWKGRVLRPPGGFRPTSGRVRAAAQDIAGPVENERVWDLCCGSGALGIECLGCGAEGCLFVDIDRRCVDFVGSTLEAFGSLDRAVLLCIDVMRADPCALPRPGFVFADPPYGAERLHAHLFGLGWERICRPGGLVMIEAGRSTPVPPGWTSRAYGDSLLVWRRLP